MATRIDEARRSEIRARVAAGESTACAIAMGISVSCVASNSRGLRPRIHLSGADHPLRRRPSLAVRGEAHGLSKLCESEIISMRERHGAGESIRSLARSHSVAWKTAAAAISGRTWAHVSTSHQRTQEQA